MTRGWRGDVTASETAALLVVLLCGRVAFWHLEGIAAEWVWRRADPGYETTGTQRQLEKKFLRVLFNGDARDAKYRDMAKWTALALVVNFPALVSDMHSYLPSEEERVEATFAQALVLLVVFFVANIFCRAGVYPLAYMVCAGRAPSVKPEADDQGVKPADRESGANANVEAATVVEAMPDSAPRVEDSSLLIVDVTEEAE